MTYTSSEITQMPLYLIQLNIFKLCYRLNYTYIPLGGQEACHFHITILYFNFFYYGIDE